MCHLSHLPKSVHLKQERAEKDSGHILPTIELCHIVAILGVLGITRLRAFLVLFGLRLLLRYLGFYSDFTQISVQKIGGWEL